MEASARTEKIHFRNKLFTLLDNDVISKDIYDKLCKLSRSDIEEDYIVATQLIRAIIVTS